MTDGAVAPAAAPVVEAALRYCPRALPLVGKLPAVGADWPHWKATRETIVRHYSRHPEHNVGIRCGRGLVVLDRDDRDGGREALAELEHEHGPLPPTPTVITGSGSRHHYFRGPPELRSRNLRSVSIPGLEIKAAGTQVAAPPSLHESGRLYCWDPAHPLVGAEIAQLPRWLAELAGMRRTGGALRRNSGVDPLQTIPATTYVPLLLGVELDHGHACLCPFHGEEEASLRAYGGDRGWYCFGCGRGGSIIDLGAALWGITPRGAGFGELRRRLAQVLVSLNVDIFDGDTVR